MLIKKNENNKFYSTNGKKIIILKIMLKNIHEKLFSGNLVQWCVVWEDYTEKNISFDHILMLNFRQRMLYVTENPFPYFKKRKFHKRKNKKQNFAFLLIVCMSGYKIKGNGEKNHNSYFVLKSNNIFFNLVFPFINNKNIGYHSYYNIN